MAAIDIYSPSDDWHIFLGGPPAGGSSWNTIRNATTGNFMSSTGSAASVMAIYASGRGAAFYDISRYFLYFNMASFPAYSSINSVTLYAYRQLGGGDTVIAVRHDAPSGHLNNPEFVFYPNHDPASGDSMTAYSSYNLSANGGNSFTLNATAIHELIQCIEGSGNGGATVTSFEVALVTGADYANSAPTDMSINTQWRTQNYSGTGSDPFIRVDYSTAAVAHNATFFGANF